MTVLPGFPLLSDSEDDHNVVELSNGQLVCCRHALIVCGKCCVDFSFMQEENDSDGDYDQETEDMYNQLSPDTRAEIDARWGPSTSNQRSQAQASSSSSAQNNARPAAQQSSNSTSPAPAATLSQEEIERFMGLPEKKRGTGRVLPTRFVPPSAAVTPQELFPAVNIYYHHVRYVHRNDRETGLIFTDGACLDNGQANPRAGYAFVAGPSNIYKNRLEKKGPFGDDGLQTSNRAELRAVLAALGFRHWPGEGFTTLVIATDSEYVVEGVTKWVKAWLKNDWKTAARKPVKNKDLWEMLLGEVERFKGYGMDLEFWRISRDLNAVADKAAKEGAAIEDVPETYSAVIGM
jgi:ribonuclease HI